MSKKISDFFKIEPKFNHDFELIKVLELKMMLIAKSLYTEKCSFARANF